MAQRRPVVTAAARPHQRCLLVCGRRGRLCSGQPSPRCYPGGGQALARPPAQRQLSETCPRLPWWCSWLPRA